MPLLYEHWREVAAFPDIPLAPDFEMYARSQAAGILRVFTARTGFTDNALVGYALFFVRPAPHYSGSIQAAQDVIYLSPAARGGTGYRLIAWCDEQLAAEGVQVSYQHVKASHDFGTLLERQGYQLVDRIFAKRLDVPVPPAGPRETSCLSVATPARASNGEDFVTHRRDDPTWIHDPLGLTRLLAAVGPGRLR